MAGYGSENMLLRLAALQAPCRGQTRGAAAGVQSISVAKTLCGNNFRIRAGKMARNQE
jgi:hypothetical protein